MFISNLSLCPSLELQIYSNYLTSFTTIILVKVLSYKVTVITSFQPISLDLTVISKRNLKFIYIWNLVLSLELHFYCNNLFSTHLFIISSITSHFIYHMFISNLHIYCNYPFSIDLFFLTVSLNLIFFWVLSYIFTVITFVQPISIDINFLYYYYLCSSLELQIYSNYLFSTYLSRFNFHIQLES